MRLAEASASHLRALEAAQSHAEAAAEEADAECKWQLQRQFDLMAKAARTVCDRQLKRRRDAHEAELAQQHSDEAADAELRLEPHKTAAAAELQAAKDQWQAAVAMEREQQLKKHKAADAEELDAKLQRQTAAAATKLKQQGASSMLQTPLETRKARHSRKTAAACRKPNLRTK